MYACPECLGELASPAGKMNCSSCGRCFPVADGIPIFARDQGFYYGELPREPMRQILAESEREGWSSAVTRYCDQVGSEFVLQYVTSPRRLGVKYLFPDRERATALDCGCGWGTLTTDLARRFEFVYAMDLTWERAKFTQIRAAQENLTNVAVLCAGDTPHLPFPPNSLDFVLLLGVLEWIPESFPGEPRATQLAFLREVRRVLREDGCAFIGIENRFGAGYLMGNREDHTHLRFGALPPRSLSNVYSKIARGRPYRTYTYSARGYRTLLREAGFATSEMFAIRPSYRRPDSAARLSSGAAVSSIWNASTRKKRIRNAVLRPVLRYIPESFGIVTSPDGKLSSPLLWEIVKHISQTHLEGRPLCAERLFTGGESPAMQAHLSSDEAQYILRLPMTPQREQDLRRGLEFANWLASAAPSARVLAIIPRPVAVGRFRDQFYVVEPLLAGCRLDSPAAQKSARELTSEAFGYITDLAKKSAANPRPWSELLREKMRAYSLGLRKCFDRRGFRFEKFEQTINRIAAWVQSRNMSEAGFTCASHGDFWAGNILVSIRQPRIVGLLDWDHYEKDSLPLLDLYNYFVQSESRATGHILGASIVEFAQEIEAGTGVAATVAEFARQLNMPDHSDLIWSLVICYWLRTVGFFFGSADPYPSEFSERLVREPLEYFRSVVA